MPQALTLLPLLAPFALAAVALLARVEPGRRPRRVLVAGRAATLLALALAVYAIAVVAVAGPQSSPVLGPAGIGLSARLDALSATLFALVAFIGVIVVAYSRNYLDGDPRQGRFTGGLCLTLAAVMLLVLAGNLVQLAAAWLATSLALQRLLCFYGDRPRARIAARKKFLVARAGDACLLAAVALLVHAFGTTDIAAILADARAASGEALPVSAPLAAVALAVAALLKSAQFPTHGWLPEVMETPTPVSALLHAGIINAGGFLVVRFADVMLLSTVSLYVLAIVGGFTALFASVVMLTQTSVKVALAYSTVAQMGFMLLQCGLGAFPIAVLHIVAHSLYKAHAFLSSGSIVEIARGSWVPAGGPRHPLRIAVSLAAALILYAAVAAALGVSPGEEAAVLALGAILVMGLTHLIAQALEENPSAYVVGRVLAAAGATTLVYFALESGARSLLAGTLPPIPVPDAAMLALMGLAVASFALVTVLQLLAPAVTASAPWRAAYVHVRNGLYANVVFDRLVGALRPSA